MSTAVAVQNGSAVSIMEEVIIKGDLAKLSADDRARYYSKVCESIGVNPLTQPFQYITLNQKLTLYATKTATDQLRTVRGVSVFKIDAETVGDLRIVHAYARDAAGREDMDIGAVNIKGLQGEALANAYMKALTKAKRRVTLSICGLGFLDESEIEAIPNARPINVNMETGEILDAPAEVEAIEGGMVTDRQLKFIGVLRSKLQLSPEEVRQMTGKQSAKELTKDEASELIKKLESMFPPTVDEPDADQSGMFDESDPDRFTR